ICRIFHHVLDMVVSPPFYNQYVHLPPKNVITPEIHEDLRPGKKLSCISIHSQWSTRKLLQVRNMKVLRC
ncbi:hypothetical protein PAXRUDRAFT_162182, partial [Paxillus rubicundulus Ve08.2h10]